MDAREYLARPDSGVVDRYAVYYGIRPREIDVFKNAEVFFAPAAMFSARFYAVFSEYEYLAGFDIPYEFGADRHYRAAFGSDNVHPVARNAVTQRTETVRITRADEFLRRHKDYGIRAVEGIHRAAHRFFYGIRLQPFPSYDIRNGLGVAGRVENGAGKFQFGTQFCGVGKIAVVRERHPPFLVVDDDRLAVAPAGRAGRAVARMRHRHSPFRERRKDRLGEHLAYKPQILVRREQPIVVDDDAAAFLPSVL